MQHHKPNFVKFKDALSSKMVSVNLHHVMTIEEAEGAPSATSARPKVIMADGTVYEVNNFDSEEFASIIADLRVVAKSR